MLNASDFFVIAILFICIFVSWKRGLIKTVFSLFSTVIALVAARFIYPHVSLFLMKTPLYESIKNTVLNAADLNHIADTVTQKAQTDLIYNLHIPDFLKGALLENNNSEIYNMLNVNGIADYISSYIAGIILNIFSMIVVFIIVRIALIFISKALNIISSLPVINTADHLGGAVFGLIQGTIIIWICFIFLTFFMTKPAFQNISENVFGSLIAVKFYESNILLDMILKIFS